MKRIQILGTGCPKCRLLTAHVEATVKALGIEATVEKVEKLADIMKFNVLMTPALVVDGRVINTPSDRGGERTVANALLIEERRRP